MCRLLRQRSQVPIIVVTARGDEIDRVILLELGADDYVVKPFGFRELVARIRAVLRRTGEQSAPAAPDPCIVVGQLAIDTRTRSVTLEGEPVSLTPKEHDLLVYLARDPGAVFTRKQLIEDVWDQNWWGSTKTLDVHIASLRKKLAPRAHRDCARGGLPPRRGDRHAVTRRLLFGYLLAALVVLLVLEIPLAIFYQQREMGRLEHDVERDATVLAGYYEEALEAGGRCNPAPAEAYAQRTGVRVVVVDKAGTSVIDTAGPAGRDFSTRPEIKTALRGGRAVGTRYSQTLKTRPALRGRARDLGRRRARRRPADARQAGDERARARLLGGARRRRRGRADRHGGHRLGDRAVGHPAAAHARLGRGALRHRRPRRRSLRTPPRPPRSPSSATP